jgi:hypothetical protein
MVYPLLGTNPGFSQADLEATKPGTVTKSNVTTSNGTTGLDIIANDVGYFSTVQIGTVSPDACPKLHKRSFLTSVFVASTTIQSHHGQWKL